MKEYWSNLVILYLGFVTISFRRYQTVPAMIALHQAFLSSLCFLGVLWFGWFFFFFSFTVQAYLFFTILKGDVYYKSARISQNGIKVE